MSSCVDDRRRSTMSADARDTAHVLLVEDDETLGDLLARHLRARGLPGRDRRRPRPTDRRARARPAPVDLVLLDINLPGDTGWSVLRSEAFAAAGSPPVVVASAMTVSPARLREFGVAGYLPKPFPLETLGRRSSACSSRRRSDA